MDYSGQLVPGDAVGYFCVASENVRNRIQVVTAGQFLVGSGTQCHLRLGDHGIPDVLCRVLATERNAQLECSAGALAVLVNGCASTSTSLQDGDLVEVGNYRLLFRLLSKDARITLDETHFATAERREPVGSDASQLVELLQQEMQLIAEHEHTSQSAIAELLTAVSSVDEHTESAQQHAAVTELSATEALRHVAELLHRQQEASRIRVESVTEVLNNVVRQQQAVADTLQMLSQRILAMEASRDFVHRRASA